jgi:predicted regulator of Ras-like GTPase activity (Roadblock/LC7/MglB family)
VASFLQLLALEQKTCTVRIKRQGDTGMLFLRNGELYDASHGEQTGLAAALEVVTWDQAEITVKNRCKVRGKRIDLGIEMLLLEAMRLMDEERRDNPPGSRGSSGGDESRLPPTERGSTMALDDHLKEFKDIKGYLASGIMDFTGETLITDSTSGDIDLEATGAVFNDIFRGAHEASNKIGLEACKKMTITTPKGLVVMECSGTDAASHLHFIVVLTADGNQALARKTLEKIVPKVVDEMS